jgi:hypothetical protein
MQMEIAPNYFSQIIQFYWSRFGHEIYITAYFSHVYLKKAAKPLRDKDSFISCFFILYAHTEEGKKKGGLSLIKGFRFEVHIN